ncbi:MAG TPA: hypothetical protein VJT31_25925, partial [Rugosimonospora sp.]|nr:hypothetical protein [Rugosimonospora sp.]
MTLFGQPGHQGQQGLGEVGRVGLRQLAQGGDRGPRLGDRFGAPRGTVPGLPCLLGQYQSQVVVGRGPQVRPV